MSKAIILSVVVGILAGYYLIPILPFGQAYLAILSNLVLITLCVLLLLVGFQIGRDDKVIGEIKAVGLKIFLFPLAAIIGTYAFAGVASIFLPLSFREAVAAAGGFGWYSFAPTILLAYSANLSAISFLQNVIREVLGVVLIPVVANKIGYIESTALAGVATMDICLPIIEEATAPHIAIYAFVTGLSMCLAVPLVGIIV